LRQRTQEAFLSGKGFSFLSYQRAKPNEETKGREKPSPANFVSQEPLCRRHEEGREGENILHYPVVSDLVNWFTEFGMKFVYSGVKLKRGHDNFSIF